jgi:DNA replication protein DnaC
VDFQDGIIERTKPGGSGDVKEWLHELLDVDVLFMDDVDKARFTPQVQTQFYKLIENACQIRGGKRVKLILTTNSKGHEFAAMFSGNPRPMLRRLADFCELVVFDQPVPAGNNEKISSTPKRNEKPQTKDQENEPTKVER